MRVTELGAASVVFLLGACSAGQLGGPPRGTGGSPPIGTTIAPPTPTPRPGTDAGTTPVPSDACWGASLPPEPLPILPTSLVADACAAGTGSPAWSYPQDPAGGEVDDRRYIVGRWQTCNGSLPMLPTHTAIEFGANGRWRLLSADPSVNQPSDGLIPLSGTWTSGYYSLLGTGQLNMVSEDPRGGGWAAFLQFAGMDTLSFGGTGTGSLFAYARIAPSPLNGADNPPPLSAGACSMVGDWDVPAETNAPAAVFSFDATGNFVVGPEGANLCDGHTGYGTYAISGGTFQLTSNVGLGFCEWWFTASYQASFDASCNQLSLTDVTDGCTGGRGYLNDRPTTLTRRTAGLP